MMQFDMRAWHQKRYMRVHSLQASMPRQAAMSSGSEFEGDTEDEEEGEEDDFGDDPGTSRKRKAGMSAGSKQRTKSARRRARKTKEEHFVPVSTLLAVMHRTGTHPACGCPLSNGIHHITSIPLREGHH